MARFRNPARRGAGAAIVALLSLAPAPFAAAGDGTLIVLNKAEATASLVDLDSGRVAATVPTGEGPHEVAVSPDGTVAVVTNYGGSKPGSTLTVIDVRAARVARTIDLGEHRRPHGIAWLPGGRRVAVTAEDSRALLIVDADSGSIEAAVATDQEGSHMVAVAPGGARAFVANIGSGSVTVIDLKRRARVATIRTGAGAEGITLTPGGKEIWVTNREADTVSVIDAGSLEVLATLESKSFPIRAQATPDGRHVLVSNARSGEVAVFDVASRKEARRVPMDIETAGSEGRLFGDRFGKSPVPIGILVRPDGRRAYVANANADRVVVVDLGTWKPIDRIRAGREPDGLGYSPLSVRPGTTREGRGGT
jgi:YVTN family beta-propeller protein